MAEDPKDQERRFALRLPAELYKEVQVAAAQDIRSMNAEIIVLLREALAMRRTVSEQSDDRV